MVQSGPQAARTTDDPARVSARLAAGVVGLLALVLILAVALLWATTRDDFGATAGGTAVEVLEAKARNTNDPALLLDLVFEYRKAGLLEDALQGVERAIALDPNSTAAHYHKGMTLFEMGDDRAAEIALWDALEIEPAHAATAKALGELYAARGQFRSLLVAVQPAAEASPALADLQYLVGLGREKTGDRRGAAEAYYRALERDPGIVDARAGLERVGAAAP